MIPYDEELMDMPSVSSQEVTQLMVEWSHGDDAPSQWIQTKVVRFTTDIPHLTNSGQSLLLGPGSILVAHTNDEFVLNKNLEEAVRVYALLVRRLFTNNIQA